ncbi:MAG: right-handed parallel beta-helix repeat-containing protein, partial [Anaerolineales bacterium]
MNKHSTVSILSLTMLFALVVSAVLTTPALADSGATNPTPPTAGSGSTRSSHSSSNNLSNVPSGTKVVIVDSNGDKVPLGSEQAQQILTSGDPVWCPITVKSPTPGSGGCTASGITGLYDLINDIDVLHTIPQPAANGTIWITATDTSTQPIVIDGSLLTNWAKFTLTLQGGWTGTGTTVNQSQPSVFNVPLSIINWNNNVALSDIVISGASGATSFGLDVSTTKNISLTRVNVNNDDTLDLNDLGYGATLNNKFTGATGTVTVTSSEFDANGGLYGLRVVSNGAITLTNSFAIGNTSGDGVELDNSSALTPQLITVTGNGTYSSSESAYNNSFDNNFGKGLLINTNGAVTITDVTASGNGLLGAPGAGAGASVTDSGITSTVTLTGMDVFNSNNGDGLDVTSSDAITATHLVADSNSNGNGAIFNNISNTGKTGTVTVNSSQFNNDYYYGLSVKSHGLITINNVTADTDAIGNFAAGAGASITNAFAGITAGVTFTGSNFFDENYQSGMLLSSNGAIKASGLEASHNSGFGAYFDNCNTDGTLNCTTTTTNQPITLTGTNTFNNNFWGFQAFGTGAMTINQLTADGNTGTSGVPGFGATLNNSFNNGTGSLTLTSGVFNNNIGSQGLYAVSNGTMTLSNLSASGNLAGGGAFTADGVDISDTSTKATVTLSGTNQFNSNYTDGLNLSAKAAITLNNLTAMNNGVSLGSNSGVGVSLDNTGGIATVKITGTNIFNGNYTGGLLVNSKGAITANSLTADCNGYSDACATGNSLSNTYGVSLNNTWTTMPGVILTGTNFFNKNYSVGLQVNTYGTISTSNLNASGNVTNGTTGDGVDLNNALNPTSTTLTAKTVILGGFNNFGDNGMNGLVVNSLGAITVSNLTANVSYIGTSTGNSVVLANNSTGMVSGVTLVGTNFFNDYQSTATNQDGLLIQSFGAISAINLTANGNGNDGVVIDNSGANPLKPQTVKLNGTNIFNSNQGLGLS